MSLRKLRAALQRRVDLDADRRYAPEASSSERTTLAGLPAIKLFGGTSFVTTAPAATTEFSPTVTPPWCREQTGLQWDRAAGDAARSCAARGLDWLEPQRYMS